jgi:hypothetical protein
MKRKIISSVGLLLFVGMVAFNAHLVTSNNQTSQVDLMTIEAQASSSDYTCWWYYLNGDKRKLHCTSQYHCSYEYMGLRDEKDECSIIEF